MELLFIDELQGAKPDAVVPISETGDATSSETGAAGAQTGEDAGSKETTTTQIATNSGGEAVDTTETQQAGSPWSFWIMIGAMILIMYFFMWRPEKKRRKQMEQFRQGIKKGDHVITAGGIYGTVKEVNETSILIESEGNTTLRIDKNMVVGDPSNGTAR